jgi:hypothetical protein
MSALQPKIKLNHLRSLQPSGLRDLGIAIKPQAY